MGGGGIYLTEVNPNKIQGADFSVGGFRAGQAPTRDHVVPNSPPASGVKPLVLGPQAEGLAEATRVRISRSGRKALTCVSCSEAWRDVGLAGYHALLGWAPQHPAQEPSPRCGLPQAWGQPGPAWHMHLGQRASSTSLRGQQWQLVWAGTQDTRDGRDQGACPIAHRGHQGCVSRTRADSGSPQVLRVLLGAHSVGGLGGCLETPGGVRRRPTLAEPQAGHEVSA